MDKKDMNIEAQLLLESILSKNPRELSFDELAFLHARREYLKPVEFAEYKDVIEKYEKERDERLVVDQSTGVEVTTVVEEPAVEVEPKVKSKSQEKRELTMEEARLKEETPNLSNETVKPANDDTK